MPTRVLIVEDDVATRASLVLLLQAEGYAADSVSDGRQALSYLRSHPPPRLVVLDLLMPVMDGWQFLAKRQGDPHLAAVPEAFLQKPFSRPPRPRRCARS
jgi:CheY-like chemotaxis protein